VFDFTAGVADGGSDGGSGSGGALQRSGRGGALGNALRAMLSAVGVSAGCNTM
jgi:hypothetical protein